MASELVPTITIPAGSRGFDALGDPTSPARMVADGWLFRTFYVAPSSRMSTKFTDKTRGGARARIDACHRAGMAVLLNFESSAERWQRGAAAGRADGVWTAGLCAELGYPAGLPILVSFDTDVTAQSLSTAVAYGLAFLDGLDGRWSIGVYGERSIIAALAPHCQLGWLAMASSWSTSPAAPHAVVHWRQRRPNAAERSACPYVGTPAGWTLDVNDALLPFPAWLPHTAAPDLITPTQEDTMRQYDYQGMILVYNGTAVRRVVSGRVSALGPSPDPVDRQSLLDLIGECHVDGPSPFKGIAGFEDPELHARWQSRPQAFAAASTCHLRGGAVSIPAVTGQITFG